MYRPEGWKGYHCGELCIECDTNPVDCNKHYEAGADAILKAINKELIPLGMVFTSEGMMHKTRLDNQFPTKNWARIVREWAHSFGKSKVVFIPETPE